MNANNTQVAGQHYQAKIQHWDYVLQVLAGRYLEGNITKYVTRHRKKNGEEDLKKALHYLSKLIEQFEAGAIQPMYEIADPYLLGYAHEFTVQNGLNTNETQVMRIIQAWRNLDDLALIKVVIEELLSHAIADRTANDARKAGFPRPDYFAPNYKEPFTGFHSRSLPPHPDTAPDRDTFNDLGKNK